MKVHQNGNFRKLFWHLFDNLAINLVHFLLFAINSTGASRTQKSTFNFRFALLTCYCSHRASERSVVHGEARQESRVDHSLL